MQKAFLVLITVVLAISLIFALIIWRQSIAFQKKACAAKQKQDDYLRVLRLQKEEEKRAQALNCPESVNESEQKENTGE